MIVYNLDTGQDTILVLRMQAARLLRFVAEAGQRKFVCQTDWL